jgi:hypothetical protein
MRQRSEKICLHNNRSNETVVYVCMYVSLSLSLSLSLYIYIYTVITHPDYVDFDAYGLFDARRHKDFLGIRGVDGRTESRTASVARAHSLQ